MSGSHGLQTHRTAVERAVLLLRTDDISSGDNQGTGQERVVGRRPQLGASSPSTPAPRQTAWTLWVSVYGRDQVERQPQALSVPAQFAKGTNM